MARTSQSIKRSKRRVTLPGGLPYNAVRFCWGIQQSGSCYYTCREQFINHLSRLHRLHKRPVTMTVLYSTPKSGLKRDSYIEFILEVINQAGKDIGIKGRVTAFKPVTLEPHSTKPEWTERPDAVCFRLPRAWVSSSVTISLLCLLIRKILRDSVRRSSFMYGKRKGDWKQLVTPNSAVGVQELCDRGYRSALGKKLHGKYSSTVGIQNFSWKVRNERAKQQARNKRRQHVK